MIEFTLPHMSCGHCVRTITSAVQRIDPQAKLEVDLPAHKVRIESSEAPSRFAAALAEQGYPAAATA